MVMADLRSIARLGRQCGGRSGVPPAGRVPYVGCRGEVSRRLGRIYTAWSSSLMAANIEIRPVPLGERAAWEPLWKGYLDFYKTSVPKDVYDTTWARLHDPAEPMRLLGA